MTSPQTGPQVLDRHYLEVRAKILEIAACLDRMDRADDDGAVAGDPRLAQLQAGIEILSSSGFDRAERVQLLFSDAYEPKWRNYSPART